MNEPTLRLDKWLWFARFFKSRSLATQFCQSGRLRLNGTPVSKAHTTVRPGDVLTFPKGPHIRVIEIVALGQRRGPFSEAQTLYADLSPPADKPEQAPESVAPAHRERGAGRPTKSDRRAIDHLRGRD